MRNRWRRQQLSPELKEEVLPKNIIMIGPTGVGKTEIARRLARLSNAPFLKIEASKFTEVGYVGRDVESMVRDLTEISLNMVKSEHIKKYRKRQSPLPRKNFLIFCCLLKDPPQAAPGRLAEESGRGVSIDEEEKEKHKETRERLRSQLREGKLDNRYVDVEVREKSCLLGLSQMSAWKSSR